MRRRHALLGVAAAVLLQLAVLAWPRWSPVLTPAVLLPVLGWGAVRFARAARRATGRVRVARWLAFVLATGWAASLAWNAIAPLLNVPDAHRVAVFALLAQVPLIAGVASLIALPAGPPTLAGKIRMVVDGAILTLSLFGLVWVVMLAEWFRTRSATNGGVAVLMLVLVLLAVLSVAVLLLVHGKHPAAGVTTLAAMAFGIGLLAVATLATIFAILVDLPFAGQASIGIVLLAALAIVASADLPVVESDALAWEPSYTVGQTLPYLPLLPFLAIVPVALTRLAGTDADMLVVWIGLLLGLAVLLRQFLSLRMNIRLTGELTVERERFAHQAYHDPLTGLANRALFAEALAAALRPDQPRAALLLIDLDGFKSVNDTRGHAVGDELLVIVAKRLRGCVRADDEVARLGGDEFAVLLPGLGDSPDAAVALGVAREILARLGEPVVVDDSTTMTVRAGIGIAVAGSDDVTPEELLRDADMALYGAKAEGPGHVRVADRALSEATLDRMRMEGDLRLALDAGQFVVHYQPIVELNSGRPTSVEALVRWQHPERGLLGPDVFLAAAESGGLLPALDRFVLLEACHQVREWRRIIPNFSVSVNVCAAHLADASLLAEVTDALATADIPPQALTLEVTETALVADLAVAAETLRGVAALGVLIALDDFGTGYSSLTYLRTLPIHILKVDRSFIRDLVDNRTDEAVTRAILGLAQSLGLRAVAEGVEEPGQADRLRQLRCGYGQGYLFARPMPSDRVPGYLQAGRVAA